MKWRPGRRAAGVVLAVVALLGAASGCSSPADDRVRVAGRVVDDVDVLAAVVPGALAAVEVRQGQQVRAGQVLARVDDAALRADTQVAQAAAAVATAQIAVVDSQIADTWDATADLQAKRAQVRSAIARAQQARADLSARRSQARDLLGRLPATPPPPGTLPPGVAAPPSRAEVEAGIAAASSALASIDTKLGSARTGLSRIESGLSSLRQARVVLADVRAITVATADAAAVTVRLAGYRQASAVVVAAADGVIVDVADPGTVLAQGAAVATIRRSDVPSAIDTWLPPDQRVCVGDTATVTADWADAPIGATVATVGVRAEYPPSYQSTDQVHLTRAIPVRLTVTGDRLPPGAPLDLTITPCPQESP